MGGLSLREVYGPPAYAMLAVNISSSNADLLLDYDLSYWGKKATRMKESLWMTLAPLRSSREGWVMDKMGRWVDPLSVPVNGSRLLHGVWSGVRHRSPGNLEDDIVINTLD